MLNDVMFNKSVEVCLHRPEQMLGDVMLVYITSHKIAVEQIRACVIPGKN